MTVRAILSAFLSLAAAAALNVGVTGGAQASEKEKRFFEKIEGEWSGPGEIVAGKYKGTKFICNLTGATPDGKIGMSLDGGCRVGLFTQEMKANVVRGKGGYSGTFLDGAAGKGLDVVGGQVSNGKVVFAIHRNQLTGAMLARLPDKDSMHVTDSVHVADELVPVIGMNLKRVETRKVGSIEQ